MLCSRSHYIGGISTAPKTRPTTDSIDAFIDALPKEEQRDDSRTLIKLMQAATRQPPILWGSAIIGFGSTPLKYANGKELDWPIIAFSPRKAALTLYLTCDIKQYESHLQKLGKYSTGVGCLYVKRLSDVDAKVLEKLVKVAVKDA